MYETFIAEIRLDIAITKTLSRKIFQLIYLRYTVPQIVLQRTPFPLQKSFPYYFLSLGAQEELNLL